MDLRRWSMFQQYKLRDQIKVVIKASSCVLLVKSFTNINNMGVSSSLLEVSSTDEEFMDAILRIVVG
jgi:hypothetical protein